MIFIVLATVVASILIFYIYRDYQNHLPGPWNLPIIGYLHKLDPTSPYLTLTKLAQKYGSIFRVKFGLINIVVVTEAKLLKKILLKDETLGRPNFFLLNMLTRRKGLVYSPLNVWKDQRKFTTNYLRMAGAGKSSQNKKRLEDLIKNFAEEFVHYVKSQGSSVTLTPTEAVVHYVSSVAGILVLGKSFSRDDNVCKNLMHNLDIIVQMTQFGGPLNFLPFLRFLPKYRKMLTTFNAAINEAHGILREYIRECEKNFSHDDPPSNFIETFLWQRSNGGPAEIYTMDQLIFLLFDIVTGSTETTSNSILWTILYLAQYQDVQDKVRQELFDVLQDKSLEMSDLPKLSYLQALFTEIARIRTIAPLGFPHYASSDIYIDDIKISKGTTIMPLLWAIHMDPKVWDEPEEFRPDRFLNEDKKFTPSGSILPFQCGKRMCVGDEFARMIIYIFIAALLKNFKIGPCESSAIDFSGVCGLALVSKPQKIVFVKI